MFRGVCCLRGKKGRKVEEMENPGMSGRMYRYLKMASVSETGLAWLFHLTQRARLVPSQLDGALVMGKWPEKKRQHTVPEDLQKEDLSRHVLSVCQGETENCSFGISSNGDHPLVPLSLGKALESRFLYTRHEGQMFTFVSSLYARDYIALAGYTSNSPDALHGVISVFIRDEPWKVYFQLESLETFQYGLFRPPPGGKPPNSGGPAGKLPSVWKSRQMMFKALCGAHSAYGTYKCHRKNGQTGEEITLPFVASHVITTTFGTKNSEEEDCIKSSFVRELFQRYIDESLQGSSEEVERGTETAETGTRAPSPTAVNHRTVRKQKRQNTQFTKREHTLCRPVLLDCPISPKSCSHLCRLFLPHMHANSPTFSLE